MPGRMGGPSATETQGPSSKEKKYDRQLRLWAASGQAALEDAHLLLVNSGTGVVGVETLKNLVLPGIGQYTIVDPEIVKEADLGVNFFLDAESLGQPRAKRCCELLQELNPDVRGHYLEESLESLLKNPQFIGSFSHIIHAGPASSNTLDFLAQNVTKNGIPFFYVQSVGFYSTFSVSLPTAFPVVDTHPDPLSVTDLRLLDPWPELEEFAKEKTRDLDSMNEYDHGHVPYVLLLLHYLEDWRSSHEGQVPQNYKQKTEFRNLVGKGARTDTPEGGEENFDEAVAAVLKSVNVSSLGSSTREVFEAEECKDLSAESANFWIIAAAVRQFHEKHGLLPLPGSVPDMKAQSADYVRLQNIYKTKARSDMAEVLTTVRSIEQRLKRTEITPEQEVEAFCKGAATVKVVRGSSLKGEGPKSESFWGGRAQHIVRELQDSESLVSIYLAFLAQTMHSAFQDSTNSDSNSTPESCVDSIILSLQKAASTPKTEEEEQSELDNLKAKVLVPLQELERAQGTELHNISALTGGLVAQEVIKVITKQYTPIDNTCIFDGITSKSAVLKLF